MIEVLLLLSALFVTSAGYLNPHYELPLSKPVEYFVADFYANLSTDYWYYHHYIDH